MIKAEFRLGRAEKLSFLGEHNVDLMMCLWDFTGLIHSNYLNKWSGFFELTEYLLLIVTPHHNLNPTKQIDISMRSVNSFPHFSTSRQR